MKKIIFTFLIVMIYSADNSELNKLILNASNQIEKNLIEKSYFNQSNNISRDCNETWISDGYCDSINNNDECQWDGGDCCGSTCISSTYDCNSTSSWGACVSECLDPNANDDCCIDNNCPFTCEGQDLITCWNGSCAENITECPDASCYDTPCSSYLNTNTCPEIEEQYGHDCSICLNEGLCPLTCEDEGLLTCVTTGQCVEDLSDCNSCENPNQAVIGTNYTSGYDEYYSFTVSETGFLTLSTAGAGAGADGDVENTSDNIDTRLFLYSNCSDVDLEYPYGNFIAENDDWGSSQYGTCPDCIWSRESYINIGINPGNYIIVSSDQFNSNNFPFEWTLTFEPAQSGCTNPLAENYDPNANIDDGSCQFSEGTYFIICDEGYFQNEVSWNLHDAFTSEIVLSGGAPYQNTVFLDESSYYLSAIDSWGDGWNFVIWSIYDSNNELILSYTLEDGFEGISDTFLLEESASCQGDVNNDEILNILDVLTIVYALNTGTTEEILDCGDLNDDGIVNVLDIVTLINIILSI